MRIKLLTSVVAASLATSALADYSNTVASLSPLGYWRLNETQAPPADLATNAGTLGLAGNGYYIGTVVHPATTALANGSGAAATFDGTGAKVSVPYTPALTVSAPFSIEAWVNPAVEQPGLASVLSCGHLGGNRSGWLIYQSLTGWNFRLYNENGGATWIDVTGGTAPVPGTWYHLAATFDGTTATVYVNGVGTSLAAPAGAFVPNMDGVFSIGTRSDSAFHYNGSVDEVALYTNALTSAEVQSHYANGTSVAPAQSYGSLVLAKSPLVYLNLDEPAFVAPDPTAYPLAKNNGSLAEEADGRYMSGSLPGQPGVPFTGMGANNYATRFNIGSGGYIDAGTSEALNFYTPFTLVAWFKQDFDDGHFSSFIGKGDASWRAGMDSDGKTRFAYGGNLDATGTKDLRDGQWHQLSGVYDGAKLFMYVDGVLDATVDAPNFANGTSAPMTIGTVPDYLTGRTFNGLIDEVAVFGSALTEAQIQQIYLSANVPPAFTQQPAAPATISEGQTITLTGVAFGSPTLVHQWFKGGSALAGKTTGTLVLPNIQLADSGDYALVVTNVYGAVTSSVVSVNVQAGPPIVTDDPMDATRYTGRSVSFGADAIGSLPLSFQWLKGGAVVAGATESVLTLNGLTSGMAGDYACKITNPYGSVTSVVATLTVVPAPTATYPAAVLADSPIGFWRLGETSGSTAYDYAGGYDGLYAGVALGQPGYTGGDADTAARFGPAINSHVASIPTIDFATNGGVSSFTVEAWVKGGAQSTDAGIVTKGTGGGGEQFNLDTGAGSRSYRFFVRDAGGGAVLANASAAAAPNGDWQHVVGVCDGTAGTVSLYVNGVFEASASIGTTAGIRASSEPVTIGSRQGGTTVFDNQFDGVIDEVAIYGYAMDSTKVAEHFLARSAPGSKPAISLQPASTTNYVTLTTLLSVVADGPDGLSYQWRRNGVDLDGAVEPKLSLTMLEAANGGDYTVVVSNPHGSSTSVVAKVTVLAAPTSLDLSRDLVLHLPFDGDLSDTSGRNNHGTNVGATTIQTGVIGSGSLRYFTDTGSSSFNYVTLGERPDLKFSSNANFSAAYWIKVPAGARTGDLPVICSARGSAFSPGYTFAPSYNEGGWSWTLNGTGVYGAQDSINDGEWHHVAHTFDRTGYAVTYLDGVQVDARSVASVGDIDQAAATNIGQDPNGTYGESGEAEVDDIGMWRRVLSPLEVAGMYVGGATSGISFSSAPVNLSVTKTGGQIQISWPGGGTLQAAGTVTGTFTNVPGAASPYSVTPTPAESYFRVETP